jgi:hypothetical protein
MTMTTRAKASATFFELAPPKTGTRGRPRLKGERIGTPAQIARRARWTTVSVSRYGATRTVKIAEHTCLWYGVWRTDTVRVILVRDTGRTSALDKLATGSRKPCNTPSLSDCSATASSSSGTPCTATTTPTRLRALVPDQDRTIHPRHAGQAPTPDHRRTFYAHHVPASNNPRNYGSPASLGRKQPHSYEKSSWVTNAV